MRVILCFLGLMALVEQAPSQVVPQKRPIPAVTSEAKATPKEQVQKPTPMTEQELRVIHSLSNLSNDRLVELLRVYEKENNEAMQLILAREILKRNPRQPDAMRVSDALSAKEETRPPEYLRLMVDELTAGKNVEDTDAIDIQARAWAESGHAKEAVQLLEKLRAISFANSPFPYLEDLASIYQDAGMLQKAEDAYRAVSKDPLTPQEVRDEAARQLQEIVLERQINQYTERAEVRPQEGLALSEKLLREHPDDPQVIGFHLDSLNRVGRYQEVIQSILALKKKSAAKPFPYQETLAYAYYGAKQYSKARSAFHELLEDTAIDTATRQDARATLSAMEIEEKVAEGFRALDKSDSTTAKILLQELEQRYPEDDDVAGLRAMVEQKGGHSDQALSELLTRKQKAAAEHRIFSQQDTLADLYLDRKEYNLAEAAYDEILNTPGYDEESRQDAVQGLKNVKREKLIDRGDRAIKNAELKLAREIGQQLQILDPDNLDVKIYEAELKLATGHARQAYDELSRIKAEHYPDSSFPGQESLADALNQLGRFEEAYSAYTELVERPGYETDDVFDAALERRALRPLIQNDLKFTSVFVDEEQGRAFRQELAYSSSWWNNWRAIVSLREDTISLRNVPILIPQRSGRMEGQAAFQRRFDESYFVEASVGGAEENVLYGARFGKFAEQGIGWSLGYYGNARTTDYSLPLELLNGRENRIQFTSSGHFNERLRFDLDAYASLVSVGGQRLGRAYGGNGNLELILQQENPTKAEITLSYVGEYNGFRTMSQVPQSVLDQVRAQDLQVRRPLGAGQELRRALPTNYGSEIFNDLISREINRHGVQVSLHRHLGATYGFFAEGEVYYEFADHSWNYVVAAGFEYWLRDWLKLYAEVRYDSDGRGPDVNSRHGALEATIGAEANF